MPEVYPELSSSCILVMEYIEGIKSSDVARLEAEGYDLALLARRGANLVMEQIFSHGFFHADPHPGNIFILPGNVVCFIDFGQMGRLSRRDQDDFTALVTSLVKRDEHEIAGGVLRTTIQLGEVDRDRLECDLVFFMDRCFLFFSDRPQVFFLVEDSFCQLSFFFCALSSINCQRRNYTLLLKSWQFITLGVGKYLSFL